LVVYLRSIAWPVLFTIYFFGFPSFPEGVQAPQLAIAQPTTAVGHH